MENEYVRESQIIDKTEDEKKSELIQNIIYTKRLLMQSHVNFEYAENGLIDYYTYNIKNKCLFLIKKAKDLGLIIDEVRVNFMVIY